MKGSIVLTTINTSASVDALYAGLKVITLLDEDQFNITPLKGVSGVSFIIDDEDLIKTLNNNSLEINNNKPEQYFWIDKDLKKWKKTLNI